MSERSLIEVRSPSRINSRRCPLGVDPAKVGAFVFAQALLGIEHVAFFSVAHKHRSVPTGAVVFEMPLHDDMGSAVFVGALQLQDDLAGAVTLSRWLAMTPGDVAAELLEFLTLIGAPAQRRMEAKAVPVGSQLLGGRPGCARHAFQTQHFLPRSRPERDAISARGCLQGQKRAFPIRFGKVGWVLLLHTHLEKQGKERRDSGAEKGT